eukprot:COSAG01_NODE_616_length_14815_cov_8.518076_25_plen_40_part_00
MAAQATRIRTVGDPFASPMIRTDCYFATFLYFCDPIIYL